MYILLVSLVGGASEACVLWVWQVGMTIYPSLTSTTTSSPALTRASSLFFSPSCVPMAAPTSNCFLSSFEANGKLRDFFKSVLAISATSSSFSLTMGSFPIIRKEN